MTKAELLESIAAAKDDAVVIVYVKTKLLRGSPEDSDALTGYQVKLANTCEFSAPEDKNDCHIEIVADEVVVSDSEIYVNKVTPGCECPYCKSDSADVIHPPKEDGSPNSDMFYCENCEKFFAVRLV